MSLSLTESGGLSVSFMGPYPRGPHSTLYIVGGDRPIEKPLSQGVNEIIALMEEGSQAEDPAMQKVKEYLRSLHVVERAFDGLPTLAPDSYGDQALREAHSAAGREEHVEFLGATVAKRDFVGVVAYVMTNTVLRPELPTEQYDPREAMVCGFRQAA